MDNGRLPDIARKAAMELLASDDEKDSAVKQVLMTATPIFKENGIGNGTGGMEERDKRRHGG